MGRGARIASYCHQDDGTSRHIGERIVGTKGIAEPTYFGNISRITDLDGNTLYTAPEKIPQAIVMEHKFLLDSIRSGRRVNRLGTLVNSTLLAIAGRMSAYSGKKFKFDWVLAKSKESLEPEVCAFVKKDIASVPVPGKTPLV